MVLWWLCMGDGFADCFSIPFLPRAHAHARKWRPVAVDHGGIRSDVESATQSPCHRARLGVALVFSVAVAVATVELCLAADAPDLFVWVGKGRQTNWDEGNEHEDIYVRVYVRARGTLHAGVSIRIHLHSVSV